MATTPAGTPPLENHATPSRTRSIRTSYFARAALGGTAIATFTVTLCPGGTSLGRLARSPSQLSGAPKRSYTCAAAWTGFVPPAAQVSRPVFVSVTGSRTRLPGRKYVAGAVIAYVAPKPFVTLIERSRGTTPCAENQVTPSCTRSRRRVYGPTAGGETIGIATTADCPGATS